MVRKEKQNRNLATSVVLGVCVGVLIIIAGVLFATFLVMREKLAINDVRYAVMATTFIAVLFGGTTASVYLKRNPLLVSLCVSGMLLLIMLSATAVFFEGQYSGVPAMLLIFLSSSLLAAFSVTKTLNRRPRYYKK